MWVLTRTINQYNQDGDYLETVFDSKPTLQELSTYFYGHVLENCTEEEMIFIVALDKGGGRESIEDEWYHLVELESGKKYNS